MDFDIVDKTIALVGKRGSGKSRMLHYIISYYKHLFDKIFLISPTESINEFYADVVEKKFTFDKYNEDWVDKLIKKLMIMNKGKNKDTAKHVLLVLDDVTSDTNFHNSETLKILFQRGRHFFITVIITSQYLFGHSGIPPSCRNNLDYLIVNKINGQSLDELEKEFNIGGLPKKDFFEMFNKSTGNYNFLIINNATDGSNDDYGQIYGTLKVPQDYLK